VEEHQEAFIQRRPRDLEDHTAIVPLLQYHVSDHMPGGFQKLHRQQVSPHWAQLGDEYLALIMDLNSVG
jgi:hypothetical protein